MKEKNISIVQALDKIRLNNLYVHNDELSSLSFTTKELLTRKVYLVETLAVINAIVDRGTMLLYGGHGGGKTTLVKYLGQIFCNYSNEEIEQCILRGHPQLTEEKILGSLDIAQLTGAKPLHNNSKVDVIWNSFVDSPWKIIDELNRLSPYAQNILLSLLAESSVKYGNESKRLPDFSLYATMNPKDEANFTISLPFLDRFAIALPITMPDYESLTTIGKRDKSSKKDDLPNYLPNFDLKEVHEEVKLVEINEDAEILINIIISNYRLCDRVSKESNDSINVDNTLCTGCHYSTQDKVCQKILNPLSVRVKEDLYRYSKALAWFLGDVSVSVHHIIALAPYMIWHRSSVSKQYKKTLIETKFKDKSFTVNIELESTKEIILKISNEFPGILPVLRKFNQVKKGSLSQSEFEKLLIEASDVNKNFIILKKEIYPSLLNQYKPVYAEIIEFNKKIDEVSDLNLLKSLKESIMFRYDIPNRQYLAEVIERKQNTIGLNLLPEKKFTVPFKDFMNRVYSECPEIFRLINIRYKNEFMPALNNEESLSDFSDSDFFLTMKRVSSITRRPNFDLIFKYRGDEKNPIVLFLSKTNVP